MDLSNVGILDDLVQLDSPTSSSMDSAQSAMHFSSPTRRTTGTGHWQGQMIPRSTQAPERSRSMAALARNKTPCLPCQNSHLGCPGGRPCERCLQHPTKVCIDGVGRDRSSSPGASWIHYSFPTPPTQLASSIVDVAPPNASKHLPSLSSTSASVDDSSLVLLSQGNTSTVFIDQALCVSPRSDDSFFGMSPDKAMVQSPSQEQQDPSAPNAFPPDQILEAVVLAFKPQPQLPEKFTNPTPASSLPHITSAGPSTYNKTVTTQPFQLSEHSATGSLSIDSCGVDGVFPGQDGVEIIGANQTQTHWCAGDHVTQPTDTCDVNVEYAIYFLEKMVLPESWIDIASQISNLWPNWMSIPEAQYNGIGPVTTERAFELLLRYVPGAVWILTACQVSNFLERSKLDPRLSESFVDNFIQNLIKYFSRL